MQLVVDSFWPKITFFPTKIVRNFGLTDRDCTNNKPMLSLEDASWRRQILVKHFKFFNDENSI